MSRVQWGILIKTDIKFNYYLITPKGQREEKDSIIHSLNTLSKYDGDYAKGIPPEQEYSLIGSEHQAGPLPA